MARALIGVALMARALIGVALMARALIGVALISPGPDVPSPDVSGY
jgi:hypothetical protein